MDNSEAAFLNEDYPGTRWGYQRQALTSLCAHYALQSGNSKEAAHPISRQSRTGMPSMCMIAAGNARLQHPPCPVRESDAALASLLYLEMAEGPNSQYQRALLLAAVSFCLPPWPPCTWPTVSRLCQYHCTSAWCSILMSLGSLGISACLFLTGLSH